MEVMFLCSTVKQFVCESLQSDSKDLVEYNNKMRPESILGPLFRQENVDLVSSINSVNIKECCSSLLLCPTITPMCPSVEQVYRIRQNFVCSAKTDNAV